MNIFLLVVKDGTPKQTQRQMKGSQVGTGSTSSGGLIIINIYTECHRRNVPDFGRVFLMLKYTDITQNIYIQS